MAQISAGIALPKADTKYEVVIRLADREILSGTAVTNPKGSTYNRFNYSIYHNKSENGEFDAPYINLDDLGSLFIYLKKGDEYICYNRSSVKDWLDPDPKSMAWVQMKPDGAIGEVKDAYKAGLIGVRIAIADITNEPFDWSKTIFGEKYQKRPKNMKVRAYIFQCRDLPAADSDGTSDPFL